jgi:hypothetical protein
MRDEARIRRQCERGAWFKRLRKESAPHREKNFQILSENWYKLPDADGFKDGDGEEAKNQVLSLLGYITVGIPSS